MQRRKNLSNTSAGLAVVPRMAVILGLSVALGACSDDSEGTPDAGPDSVIEQDAGADLERSDVGAPDAAVFEHNIGEGCDNNSACMPNSPVCIMYDADERLGICSMECTPDNPDTPLLVEDDCPRGYVCGDFRFSEETYHYCLKACTPSLEENPCPESSGQSCSPASAAFASFGKTVCWYRACESSTDCPVFSAVDCTGDTICTEELGSEAFCLSGSCALPGDCTAGGLCGGHTHGKADAKIGDPCESDLDCANNGFCFSEDDGYPNGYCASGYCDTGIAGFECGAGAACHRLYYGGVCHKSCDQLVAGDCRGADVDKGGDYECYALNNLAIGDAPVSEGAICTVAANESCDGLGGDMDCTILATPGNPTHMGCRDPQSGQLLENPLDPSGFCLDDTASGAFPDAPDGGAPQDGGPDADAMDAGVDADAA